MTTRELDFEKIKRWRAEHPGTSLDDYLRLQDICPRCGGFGKGQGHYPDYHNTCPRCRGSGKWAMTYAFFQGRVDEIDAELGRLDDSSPRRQYLFNMRDQLVRDWQERAES